MNLWDILVAAVLAAVVFLALRKIVRDRRSGKSCCGDCSSCGCGCGGSVSGKNVRDEKTGRQQ